MNKWDEEIVSIHYINDDTQATSHYQQFNLKKIWSHIQSTISESKPSLAASLSYCSIREINTNCFEIEVKKNDYTLKTLEKNSDLIRKILQNCFCRYLSFVDRISPEITLRIGRKCMNKNVRTKQTLDPSTCPRIHEGDLTFSALADDLYKLKKEKEKEMTKICGCGDDTESLSLIPKRTSLKEVIPAHEIKAIVNQVAEGIESTINDLENKTSGLEEEPPRQVIFIVNLTGGFVFFSDLYRAIDSPFARVGFVQTSSYYNSLFPMSPVVLERKLGSVALSIKDSHVVIVDDIIDTGHTMNFLTKYISLYEPCTIQTCALILKPESREAERLGRAYAEHVGKVVSSDDFYVGYGMGEGDSYRNLKSIYSLTRGSWDTEIEGNMDNNCPSKLLADGETPDSLFD